MGRGRAGADAGTGGPTPERRGKTLLSPFTPWRLTPAAADPPHMFMGGEAAGPEARMPTHPATMALGADRPPQAA